MIFRRKKTKQEEPVSNEEFMQRFLFESVKERKWRNITSLTRATALLLMASVGTYIALKGPSSNNENIFNDDHTAIIKINGNIDSQRTANADEIYKLLEKAFENDNAKAVILSINSPGGSPVQAGRIYDDVLAFKDVYDKPVYAYIDDVGASAGYYIALSADKIYANRASLVGSIGVISTSFGFVDIMNAFGIERRTIKSGENKNFLDPFAPLHQEQAEFWQQQLRMTHEQFVQRVVDSRGENLDLSEYGLFTGLIWNGEEAARIGLIDGLSSPHKIAAQEAGEQKLVEYRIKKNFFTNLSNSSPFNFGSDKSSEFVETVLTEINAQSLKLK